MGSCPIRHILRSLNETITGPSILYRLEYWIMKKVHTERMRDVVTRMLKCTCGIVNKDRVRNVKFEGS